MNLEIKTSESNQELEFSPLALTDLKETWQYLSEQNEEVAEKLIRQIMIKCEFLLDNPKIGRERPDLIIGLRQFPFKSHNIYYFITDFGIEIYRVLHSSRDNIQVFNEILD